MNTNRNNRNPIAFSPIGSVRTTSPLGQPMPQSARPLSLRLPALCSMAIISCIAIESVELAQAGTRKIDFVNNTGQVVDDLHLELANGSTIDFSQTTPFENERGVDGGSSHNLYGANVAAGGTATIRMTSTSNQIKINKWWWTSGGTALRDGARVGDVRGDDGGATLSVHDGLSAGDGSVLVSINGMERIYNTIPGADPLTTLSTFYQFVSSLSDGDFPLIHATFEPSTTRLAGPLMIGGVDFFGNILGDESLELRAEILTQDSLQPLQLTTIPEPATLGLLAWAAAIGMFRCRRT